MRTAPTHVTEMTGAIKEEKITSCLLKLYYASEYMEVYILRFCFLRVKLTFCEKISDHGLKPIVVN